MICDELLAVPFPSTSSHDQGKGDDEVSGGVRISHVVVLAWTASGMKRVRGDTILDTYP